MIRSFVVKFSFSTSVTVTRFRGEETSFYVTLKISRLSRPMARNDRVVLYPLGSTGPRRTKFRPRILKHGFLFTTNGIGGHVKTLQGTFISDLVKRKKRGSL